MNRSFNRGHFLKVYRRQLNKELRQMGYGQPKSRVNTAGSKSN